MELDRKSCRNWSIQVKYQTGKVNKVGKEQFCFVA